MEKFINKKSIEDLMENYDDINATFRVNRSVNPREYILGEEKVYEPISRGTYRINPKSNFGRIGTQDFFDSIINMKNVNGTFVSEDEIERMVLEEDYVPFTQRLRNSLQSLKGLVTVLTKGEDKDVINFLKK